MFADFTGHVFAHIYTLVALIEFMSASSHEHASRRLAMAHEFLSCKRHQRCRDWFECLLITKAALLDEDKEEELNYFSGKCVCVCVCVCERERERERDDIEILHVITGWWDGSVGTIAPPHTWWASHLTLLWDGNCLMGMVDVCM